jgi:DNA-binding NarL/FixJ family response regulator
VDELTERERDVFRLIGRGHSNAEIGRERYISDTTIKDARHAYPPEAQPS